MKRLILALAFPLVACTSDGKPSDGSPNPGKDGGQTAQDAATLSDAAAAHDATTATDGASHGDDDASTATDAAANDAGGGIDSGSTEGKVPVFLAMGYGTRRIVSCDYGLTWTADAEDIPNGNDDGYLVRGLAYGEGKFVAAVGGGGTQKLFTTEDGVDFTRFDRGAALGSGNGFSDVAYGNGYFVAGGGHISTRSDDGITWGSDVPMGSGGILRTLVFGNYDGGRFVAVGDQGRRMNSHDATVWGSEQSDGAGFAGIAYGAGLFVAVRPDLTTSYSEDGGDTWKSGSVAATGDFKGILYDGARFIVSANAAAYTSTNGKSWTGHPGAGGPGGLTVSDDRKHYVAASGGDLYHSTNGLNYTSVHTGGQSINAIAFGWVEPSTTCPLPAPAP